MYTLELGELMTGSHELRFDPVYLHQRETGEARFDESQNELSSFSR